MKPNYCNGEFRLDFNESKPCPKCNQPLPLGYMGALSRRDNKTEICSKCGTEEALEDFTKAMNS